MIELPVAGDDASEFLNHVQLIVESVVRVHRPRELMVVRIDNWFGPRWLRFSGKMLGALGVWKNDLTLPPFVPSRVTWQKRYRCLDDRHGLPEIDDGPALHLVQSSVENRKRKLSQIAANTGFVWYSGRSKENRRGAIMAYVPIDDGWWTWYAGFVADETWRLSQTKGITRAELVMVGARTDSGT